MLKNLSCLCKFYNITGNLLVYQPNKSKKELLAHWVIDNALKTGELSPGQAVAEITAGNFGIALAKECKKINSPLYLVPLGTFPKRILDKLSIFNNVIVVNAEQNRNPLSLKNKLEEVISSTGAYSFRQFDNNKQVDFYKNLLNQELKNLSIDAVFEKVGTGATLQAIKEVLHDSNSNPKFFIAKPDVRQIETAHMILSLDGVIQTHPADRNEYVNNFEQILKQTENLTDLHYAKLSIFCAIEWLKTNPNKTAFVFIGD